MITYADDYSIKFLFPFLYTKKKIIDRHPFVGLINSHYFSSNKFIENMIVHLKKEAKKLQPLINKNIILCAYFIICKMR